VPDESMNAYVPMDFTVRWGFPLIAKGAVGVLGLLVAGVALAIVWFVRRVW
jgi:hypothetical protein